MKHVQAYNTKWSCYAKKANIQQDINSRMSTARRDCGPDGSYYNTLDLPALLVLKAQEVQRPKMEISSGEGSWSEVNQVVFLGFNY